MPQARFRGWIAGRAQTVASRIGGPAGIALIGQSNSADVSLELYQDGEGRDCYRVVLREHAQGNVIGASIRTLIDSPVLQLPDGTILEPQWKRGHESANTRRHPRGHRGVPQWRSGERETRR